MSNEGDKSSPMSDADVANGEGDDSERIGSDEHASPRQAPAVDPDSPGASVLGLTDGDAVEPNEPG